MRADNNLLFSSEQIRARERVAIQSGISEDKLMARAGRAAFSVLRTHYSHVKHIAVFCGGGNNGGDGYWVAYLAALEGIKVYLFQAKSLEKRTTTAQRAAQKALSNCEQVFSLGERIPDEVTLIVDALLGIGLSGSVKNSLISVIQQINTTKLPVLSIDVPSGLQADTGCVLGACVKATLTVTFIGRKRGMFTLDGMDYCGTIICDTLGLDMRQVCPESVAQVLDDELIQTIRPIRPKNVHKGLFGHVLILGGGPGMPGAVHLAAHAALKIGAGTVTVATWPEHAEQALCGLPEVMIYGISSKMALAPRLERASVCVIGPGLGEGPWAEALLQGALDSKLPLVVDASALRLLEKVTYNTPHWVLTPHPGEAAALLHREVNDLQKNRFKAVEALQENYGGAVVLKGAGTLIQTEEKQVFVNAGGHPGMATAGMGDVLSGIIGGLIAQNLTLSNAAMLGVFMHTKAAEKAISGLGAQTLTAGDLMAYIHL